MRQVAILLLSVAITITNVRAECGICQQNGVACIGKSEFQICANGNPITTKNFTCPTAGHVCTNQAIICFEEGGFDLGCGDISECDVCVMDGTYTCTSRNSFKLCLGGGPLGGDSICPAGRLCDPAMAAAGDYPCALLCTSNDAKKTICDRDLPADEDDTTTTPTSTTPTDTTPTETTPTTPSTVTPTDTTPTTPSTVTPTDTTPSTPSTVTPTDTTPTTQTTPSMEEVVNTACTLVATSGRFPNVFDDSCRTYLYCFPVINGWNGILGTCPNNLFFNPATRVCEAARPSTCSTSTTPTTPATTPTTPATTPTTLTTPTTITTTPTTTASTASTASTGSTASTPTTAVPTPSPQDTANARCGQLAVSGRYPNPSDNTCKTYLYCFQSTTGWSATIGSCLNNLYFNPSTSTCGTAKPATCV